MNKFAKYIPWVPALFVSLVVLIPSLLFKFSGAAESRHIFTTVGEFLGLGLFEPYGRYLIGTAELVAAILLLVPRAQVYGALLTLGVLSGAIFFHLFSPLGVVVHWVENGSPQQDGTLFILALVSFISALVIVFLRRDELVRQYVKKANTQQKVTHTIS